jgi:inosine-uridine nucleoside N-ribohydrolase
VPVPWLIDTDPGIDDALALLMAFASPEVSIEAITSVAGNVPVDFTTANVHRILSIGAPDSRIRVARGAAAPTAPRCRPTATTASEHQPPPRRRWRSATSPAAARRRGPSADGPILEMAGRFPASS